MNIDRGLLMVMWPVLKSCRSTGKQTAEESMVCAWAVRQLHAGKQCMQAGVRGCACMPCSGGPTCMRDAADDVDAMTKPEMARPAITPPPEPVAQAANANMHTWWEQAAHLSNWL